MISYNITNMIYTAINIPYGILATKMTSDVDERGSLNVYRMLFENGGYKLSSTSNMTWLGKIYLSQYVHKEIFNIDESIINRANAVHKEWLLHDELSYWAWSDQILNFEIKGSKYYHRGVTSILWTTIKS